jgi:type II secretory pathway component PulL
MTVVFLYLFMATLFGLVAVSLGTDVWKNHYADRPMRPMVMWIAAMMCMQSVHFVLLSFARFYANTTGERWQAIDGVVWLVVMVLMAVAVTGFYSSFRIARSQKEL